MRQVRTTQSLKLPCCSVSSSARENRGCRSGSHTLLFRRSNEGHLAENQFRYLFNVSLDFCIPLTIWQTLFWVVDLVVKKAFWCSGELGRCHPTPAEGLIMCWQNEFPLPHSICLYSRYGGSCPQPAPIKEGTHSDPGISTKCPPASDPNH